MSKGISYYLPNLDEKSRGMVAGWGLGRQFTGPIDQALRWIPVDVVNNTFCEEAYNMKLDCHQFCGASNNTVESLLEVFILFFKFNCNLKNGTAKIIFQIYRETTCRP